MKLKVFTKKINSDLRHSKNKKIIIFVNDDLFISLSLFVLLTVIIMMIFDNKNDYFHT